MQSKSLTIMGGLLALQVGLAALLFVSSGPDTAPAEPLLTLEADQVQSLKLASSEATIQLNRSGEGWQLEGGLPADSGRVTSLLESLTGLKTGWPVADTEAARERMEVADTKFRTQVTLAEADGASSVVYLGTTPSFRQTHIRRAGEDEVYALNFDGYSAGTSRDYWLDAALLRPRGEVKRISVGDFSVARTDAGAWPEALEASVPAAAEEPAQADAAEVAAAADGNTETGAEASADEPAKPVDEAAKVVKFDPKGFTEVLTTLTVLGEAGASANLDRSGDGVERFSFTIVADAEHRYELIKVDSEYYLKRDDYPGAFRLSQYQYNQLAQLKEYTEVAQG